MERITRLSDLDSSDLKGKRVLVRVDFNVPLDKEQNITDDSRIVAALDTIKHLIKNESRIILISHLGRPKGKVVEELRLDPVAQHLSNLIGQDVAKLDFADQVGSIEKVAKMQNGQVCLLENIRFFPQEEANDTDFAKSLAGLANLYVNDAFGTAHRAHASTVGVTSYLSPAVAGFLMARELEMLGEKLDEPELPFTAIIGGAKVSSKISVLKELVKKVDTLLIGGGMAYTFFKAQGGKVGDSLCEDEHLETAREILALAEEYGSAIVLPEDSICVASKDDSGNPINVFEKYNTRDSIDTQSLPSNAIADNWQAMDIGPKAAHNFAKIISQSRTVVWNGPVGVFEYNAFETGTKAVAIALTELTKKDCTTIIGGGDSVAALEKFALGKDEFTHVSTGGGASLEFLEGKVLPGVNCLNKIEVKEEQPS